MSRAYLDGYAAAQQRAGCWAACAGGGQVRVFGRASLGEAAGDEVAEVRRASERVRLTAARLRV